MPLVTRIVPMRRITSVEIGVGPGHRGRLPERSCAAKEPQAVPQNRTSKGAVHVERVDERGRFQNPDAPQGVVNVVRLGTIRPPRYKTPTQRT